MDDTWRQDWEQAIEALLRHATTDDQRDLIEKIRASPPQRNSCRDRCDAHVWFLGRVSMDNPALVAEIEALRLRWGLNGDIPRRRTVRLSSVGPSDTRDGTAEEYRALAELLMGDAYFHLPAWRSFRCSRLARKLRAFHVDLDLIEQWCGQPCNDRRDRWMAFVLATRRRERDRQERRDLKALRQQLVGREDERAAQCPSPAR